MIFNVHARDLGYGGTIYMTAYREEDRAQSPIPGWHWSLWRERLTPWNIQR